MVTLILNSEECDVLKALLECALSDLHSEIVHTDNRCYKEALKDRKEILLRLQNELQLEAAS